MRAIDFTSAPWPPNWSGSSIKGIPSCGKFEVEWTLEKLVQDYARDKLALGRLVAKHFNTTESEAADFVAAAWAKLTAWADYQKAAEPERMANRVVVRRTFNVQTCPACHGEGGYRDVDESWCRCSRCSGYGEVYDESKLPEILGLEEKGPYAAKKRGKR